MTTNREEFPSGGIVGKSNGLNHGFVSPPILSPGEMVISKKEQESLFKSFDKGCSEGVSITVKTDINWEDLKVDMDYLRDMMNAAMSGDDRKVVPPSEYEVFDGDLTDPEKNLYVVVECEVETLEDALFIVSKSISDYYAENEDAKLENIHLPKVVCDWLKQLPGKEQPGDHPVGMFWQGIKVFEYEPKGNFYE